MKKFLSLFLAGIAGGMVVLAALWWMPTQPTSPIPISTTDVKVQVIRHPFSTENAIPSFVEAAKRALPSVVHIFAEKTIERRRDGEYQAGSGSGVIYSSDGYIITNEHVVGFANKIEITLQDKRQFKAKLIGSYPKADLAVLKIEAENLPTLDIANSDKAQVGEWVLAIGNPLELTSTVTAGIISAKGRNLNLIEEQDAIESFIQTDAAVNPGNSGGALVNAQGDLVGINTAISSSTGFFQGYSFAIPIKLVKRVVDDIINYGYYRRPYLGVIIRELEKEDTEELNLHITQGIRVLETEVNGSAAKAGIREDDVIFKVNDRRIYTISDLQEVISESHVGDVLSISLYRNSEELELKVELKPGE